MIEPLITIDEVAKRMGVSVRHVHALKAKKRIPYIKVSSKCLRFRWSRVEEALARLTVNEIGYERPKK